MIDKLQLPGLPDEIQKCTKLQFIVLDDNEEIALIDEINSGLTNEPIKEFKIIKKGYASGLWRKTKNLAHDQYFYMQMDLRKTVNNNPVVLKGPHESAAQFGMCITVDFKHLAAVIYSQRKIKRLVYFPKGLHSEWNYLWTGYKKAVTEVGKSIVGLKLLHKANILGDELHIISDCLIPIWCRRNLRVLGSVILI